MTYSFMMIGTCKQMSRNHGTRFHATWFLSKNNIFNQLTWKYSTPDIESLRLMIT